MVNLVIRFLVELSLAESSRWLETGTVLLRLSSRRLGTELVLVRNSFLMVEAELIDGPASVGVIARLLIIEMQSSIWVSFRFFPIAGYPGPCLSYML